MVEGRAGDLVGGELGGGRTGADDVDGVEVVRVVVEGPGGKGAMVMMIMVLDS